jgi:hypothetical protein
LKGWGEIREEQGDKALLRLARAEKIPFSLRAFTDDITKHLSRTQVADIAATEDVVERKKLLQAALANAKGRAVEPGTAPNERKKVSALTVMACSKCMKNVEVKEPRRVIRMPAGERALSGACPTCGMTLYKSVEANTEASQPGRLPDAVTGETTATGAGAKGVDTEKLDSPPGNVAAVASADLPRQKPQPEPPEKRLMAHYSPDAGPGLIVELPGRLTKALATLLGPNEPIYIALRGSFKEALVCTDTRVIIIKGGFFTQQTFGTTTYQLPYASIAGAEVKAHLLTGYFQLNAGGMERTHKSWWAGPSDQSRETSPQQAPNSISLGRAQFPLFQRASAFIVRKVAEAHGSAPAVQAATNEGSSHVIIRSIEELGHLRDSGLLTDEEFHMKKAELLRRL